MGLPPKLTPESVRVLAVVSTVALNTIGKPKSARAVDFGNDNSKAIPRIAKTT